MLVVNLVGQQDSNLQPPVYGFRIYQVITCTSAYWCSAIGLCPVCRLRFLKFVAAVFVTNRFKKT